MLAKRVPIPSVALVASAFFLGAVFVAVFRSSQVTRRNERIRVERELNSKTIERLIKRAKLISVAKGQEKARQLEEFRNSYNLLSESGREVFEARAKNEVELARVLILIKKKDLAENAKQNKELFEKENSEKKKLLGLADRFLRINDQLSVYSANLVAGRQGHSSDQMVDLALQSHEICVAYVLQEMRLYDFMSPLDVHAFLANSGRGRVVSLSSACLDGETGVSD